MEVKDKEPAKMLNLGRVNHTNWTKSDYENLKKIKGMSKSLRGSQIIKDVISNLQIRSVGASSSGAGGADGAAETNYNTIYQKFYGESFGEFLSRNKVTFRSMMAMRKAQSCEELLDIRARMVDWMIEVFTVYSGKGSNEYTYFKAVVFLDTLIDSGVVNPDNIHIYGIACMYLASNILDYGPMTIEEAYKDLAHGQFKKDYILKYINKTIEALEFNFRMPTWIEYLDKVIYDTFGDYREHLAEFNIRQTAVFALHACAFDVRYYSWDPFHLATVTLLYAINCFFSTFEKNQRSVSELEKMMAQTSQENIVNHILNLRKANRPSVRQGLQELNEYLESLKARVKDSTYKQLSNLFHFEL